MKPYAVLEHVEGFAVWQACPEWAVHGACRLELWCQCWRDEVGPWQGVRLVAGTRLEAEAAMAVLQREFVAPSLSPGLGEGVFSCGDESSDASDSWPSRDVPY